MFRKDHFLCQEQECEEEKFVVFRTEIDIKGNFNVQVDLKEL